MEVKCFSTYNFFFNVLFTGKSINDDDDDLEMEFFFLVTKSYFFFTNDDYRFSSPETDIESFDLSYHTHTHTTQIPFNYS